MLAKLAAALVLVLATGGVAFADPPTIVRDGGLPPSKDLSKDKDGVTERARLEVQPAGKAITNLTIDNPLGDVRVEGYDGTALQIETRKHAPNAEALDRLRISLVPNPDGSVRISTTADGGKEVSPLARGAVRIDLVIRAPRDAHVDAAASSGALDISNLDAGGELDTASGSISARNVSGEVVTHTLSGFTSLAQVFGIVDAQALASDVELDTIAGERLIASSSHGKIGARRVRSRDIQLTTTDGKIVLEAEVALHGRLVISSVGGDVDVKLHRRAGTVVRARGAKVDFGQDASQAVPGANGWLALTVSGDGEPAAVELSSRLGVVRFAFVQ